MRINENRGFIPVIIGIVVLVALVVGGVVYETVKKPAIPPDTQRVGNNRDSRACNWRPTKTDYGPCALFFGSYFNGERCIGIGGCEMPDGVPFTSIESCRAECEATTTPSTAPSNIPANWKTYKNDKYGFEFKYPPDFIIDQSNSDWVWFWSEIQSENKNCNQSTKDCIAGPVKIFAMSVKITPSVNQNLETSYKNSEIYKKEFSAFMGVKDLVINGNSAIQAEYCLEAGTKENNCNGRVGRMMYDIFIIHESMMFNFVISTPDASKILSSFKFTDSQIDTSEWKTYRNDKYGFEFKYPPDFVIGDSSDNTSNFDVQILVTRYDKRDEPITDDRVFVIKNYSWDSGGLQISDITNSIIGKQKPLDYIEQKNGTYTIARFYIISTDERFKYVIISDGKYYTALQFNPIAGNDENFIKQFISSFKFTDSQIDTSDWKTYRNEKYGFEIKYPKNYADLSLIKSNEALLDVGIKNNGSYGNYFILRTLAPTIGCGADLYTSQLIKDGNTQREKILKADESASVWKTWKKFPAPGLANDQVYISRKKCLPSEPVFEIEFGKGPSVSLDTQTNDEILSTFKFTPK